MSSGGRPARHHRQPVERPRRGSRLTLRAVIGNGDFPQYRTFHTHRERERLYPRPDQHNYELLA